MYLVGADRLTYYHGASTRDRALTPKHGPTAIFWHAMRLAAKRRFRLLDIERERRRPIPPTCISRSPTSKRRWGGRHVEVLSVDITLARAKVLFQEWVLKPLWGRTHPLYLRAFRRQLTAERSDDD